MGRFYMITDFSSLFIISSIGAPVLILLMFLPTIVELRKPVDSGPRLILPAYSAVLSQKSIISSIVDVEGHHELDFILLPLVAKAVGVLPNLETYRVGS
jgi:hypothetical protein